MNILFVTQFFYPENFRINDLARRLMERGHSVTVLTGMPNYPGGDFYEGYGFFGNRYELMDGVRILRVPVIPRKKGFLFLSLNYLSFIISGCLRAFFMKADDFDIIYAFGTSPITQALPALVIKKRRNCRVILNVQDLWPDNVTAITGLKNPFCLFWLGELVDFIYNRCDLILGTSRSFVRAIKSRPGLKEKRKVAFWPQYSVVERSGETRRDLLKEGVFHVVFTGNVGQGQGLETAIRAARLLKDRYEGRLHFDIVGDGRQREALEQLARELSVLGSQADDLSTETLKSHKAGPGPLVRERKEGMVFFHGSYPEEEIPAILNTADAALLILKEDDIFKRTIPAKLQTYLACGCCVVACAKGETKSLIEDNGIGICSRGIFPSDLADAVEKIMNMDEKERRIMRRRALRLSRDMFDASSLIDDLEYYMECLS